MARKVRDYSNLKETERLYDAVKRTNTFVKDYSLQHIIIVSWEPSNEYRRTRIVEVSIGDKTWRGKGGDLLKVVNEMLEISGTDDFPRAHFKLRNMEIDTRGVNKECLVDHIARITVDKNTAVVDLEELLKATRYA